MKKLIIVFSVLLLTACGDYDNNDTPDDTPEAVDVKLSTIEYAAHGNKSFNVTAVTVADGVIQSAKVDEYQFWSYASYPDVVCVPNGSDMDGLGDFYDGDTQCLGSKRANSDIYSAKMAEIAGATNKWIENITAIEEYAIGKTVDELKQFDEEADTIAGSTLVDTYGYLQSIIAAADEVNATE